jgi:hypothetical protein
MALPPVSDPVQPIHAASGLPQPGRKVHRPLPPSPILDPATLRWIGCSHFEPDECGALRVVGGGAAVRALCGFVGNMVMLQDFADRAPALADDEACRSAPSLRYLATPPCRTAGTRASSSTRPSARSSAPLSSSSRAIPSR